MLGAVPGQHPSIGASTRAKTGSTRKSAQWGHQDFEKLGVGGLRGESLVATCPIFSSGQLMKTKRVIFSCTATKVDINRLVRIAGRRSTAFWKSDNLGQLCEHPAKMLPRTCAASQMFGRSCDTVTVRHRTTAAADDEERHPEDGVSSSVKAPEARNLHIELIKRYVVALK